MTNTKTPTPAPTADKVLCKSCEGVGSVPTGIEEFPDASCTRCNGDGYEPTPAPTAAPQTDAEKLQALRDESDRKVAAARGTMTGIAPASTQQTDANVTSISKCEPCKGTGHIETPVSSAASGELLPCPFCGGEPSMHPNDLAPSGRNMGSPGVSAFYAYCDRCGAEGPPENFEGDAVVAWNRRATATPRKGTTPEGAAGEPIGERYNDGVLWYKGHPPHGTKLYTTLAPQAAPEVPTLTLDNAPIGTKAPADGGGRWYRTAQGWKWNGPDGSGGTFPRPGGDWNGRLIAPVAAPEAPYRVAEFWSSANPGKKVRMLAEGADIVEWAKRGGFIRWVDAPVAAPEAPTEQLCPACQGSGEGVMMEGQGPDAYEVPCNCPHCNGTGGLLDAYNGLVALLDAEREKYLQLCGRTFLAAPEAPASEQQARDWIEDAPHENGNYQCMCSTCGNTFIGHKRRVTCKSCAEATTASAKKGQK